MMTEPYTKQVQCSDRQCRMFYDRGQDCPHCKEREQWHEDNPYGYNILDDFDNWYHAAVADIAGVRYTPRYKALNHYGFPPYQKHSPTIFDSNIALDDYRDSWAIMPVSRTRDSGCLDNSNFNNFLEGLGGEDDTVEVHRFGHWEPGWYEIIIVDPLDDDVIKLAYDMVAALQDYPVLDEDDLSKREYEEAQESWENCYRSDVERDIESCLDIDDAAEIVEWWSSNNGLPEYESHSDGARFNVDGISRKIMDAFEESDDCMIVDDEVVIVKYEVE